MIDNVNEVTDKRMKALKDKTYVAKAYNKKVINKSCSSNKKKKASQDSAGPLFFSSLSTLFKQSSYLARVPCPSTDAKHHKLSPCDVIIIISNPV
jgi:hypothetical protein